MTSTPDTRPPRLAWWGTIAAIVVVTGAVFIPPWPESAPMSRGQGPGASGAPATPERPSPRPRAIHEGDLTITMPGTVIDSLDIRGFVRVEAPGVTIKDSIIRGRETDGHAILLYAGSGTSAGLNVIDTEFAPDHFTHLTNGVYGYDFTLTRVHIHHVVDAVHIFGDNVTIEDSRFHDHLHFANDPAHDGGPSHDDGVQIQSGRNIRIIGNTFSDAHNAAVQITQDQGTVGDITIRDNTMSGGGCTINIAEKGLGPIEGLTITGNTFGESRFACAILVPPTTPAEVADNRALGTDTVRVDRRAQ